MYSFNRFILRNHLAQDAIEHAENNDFERAKMLLRLLENPFSDKPLQELIGDFKCKLFIQSLIKIKF